MASTAPIGTVAPPLATSTPRLTSLDVFRGATMLFMASEIMRIPAVAREFPDSGFARGLARHLDHVPWTGGVVWDLIQPAFMFMVGVALPFSIASRMARGQSFGRLFRHSVFRAIVLVALGIFLRSQGRPQTYFTFEDVLTQIGLGYVFLFLLAWTSPRVQWITAAGILVGYWTLFALFPLPPPGFDTTTVGVPRDWPHLLGGFEAHWNKNTNPAHVFDVWFLNLFPRERPFAFNGGGYLTLNFVPSLATMIFGLIAGGLLTRPIDGLAKVRRLLVWGVGGIALGWLVAALGLGPIVKRIWTPTWTLVSTGWVMVLLAALYYAIDIKGRRGWTLPFVVVGTNSMAMYVLVHVAEHYVTRSLAIHLGGGPFQAFGPVFTPITIGAATIGVFWLILYWMYRNRVLIRI